MKEAVLPSSKKKPFKVPPTLKGNQQSKKSKNDASLKKNTNINNKDTNIKNTKKSLPSPYAGKKKISLCSPYSFTWTSIPQERSALIIKNLRSFFNQNKVLEPQNRPSYLIGINCVSKLLEQEFKPTDEKKTENFEEKGF